MLATSTDVPLGDGKTSAYSFADALTAEYAKLIGAACSFDWLALSLRKFAQDANPIVRVWPIGHDIGLAWAQVTICFIYACSSWRVYQVVVSDEIALYQSSWQHEYLSFVIVIIGFSLMGYLLSSVVELMRYVQKKCWKVLL